MAGIVWPAWSRHDGVPTGEGATLRRSREARHPRGGKRLRNGDSTQRFDEAQWRAPGPLNRREFLRTVGATAAAGTTFALLLSACGAPTSSSAPSPVSGTGSPKGAALFPT